MRFSLYYLRNLQQLCGMCYLYATGSYPVATKLGPRHQRYTRALKRIVRLDWQRAEKRPTGLGIYVQGWLSSVADGKESTKKHLVWSHTSVDTRTHHVKSQPRGVRRLADGSSRQPAIPRRTSLDAVDLGCGEYPRTVSSVPQ